MFVVSGGQGADEQISEAEAMKRYLIEERGVPASSILKEDQSTTTFENLRNSKVIMDARSNATQSAHILSSGDNESTASDVGDSPKSLSSSAIAEHRSDRVERMKDRRSCPYRVAVVTSDYHVFRAGEYARELGLKSDGVGSHTKGYYWPTAFIREFIAISRAHFWPYAVIAVLWVVWMLFVK
ncbi:YdcF family protein [Bifidobacterium sp. ESL0682]|uniref:YdcF family protein n=1 Tax=Bifidobacterium sp. ESL0682 TaxID=2983212 RepID=UPI0023F727A4|nr:YdcF family protein [Bifidobacterium sp. ESL0682]WEV41376.1 YdcF family protein [Bifidobacterium sp. ESL0682]